MLHTGEFFLGCLVQIGSIVKMAKRQLTLTGMLSGTKKMKSTESSNTGEADHDGRTERSEDVSPTVTELSPQCDVRIETEIEKKFEGDITECSSLCCTDDLNAFQPKDKQTLMLLSGKSRNFQPTWQKSFHGLLLV